jgi:hypothetical protein
MSDQETRQITVSPSLTVPTLPAVMCPTAPTDDAPLPTGIMLIPGATRQPTMRLPRQHSSIVHHHREKNVMVLSATVLILIVAFIFAATPLGAAASEASASAYQASANAIAEAQHKPAPFPTPAKGKPPVTSSAPSKPTVPTSNDTPHINNVHTFICTLLPWARYASRYTTDSAGHPWRPSVILAQWAVEQGGRIPSYTGYNLGNVSAIAGFPSVNGLAVVGSPGHFAFAYTLSQGVKEYLIFANNKHHYAGVNAAYPAGAAAQAYALGRSPWDAAHYNGGGGPVSSLVQTMNRNNLYRFDNPQVGC